MLNGRKVLAQFHFTSSALNAIFASVLTMDNQSSKVYFPGLNGLRFFAALAVVLTHLELMKKLLGHGERLWVNDEKRSSITAISGILNGEIRWATPFISSAGTLGVVFFFVLSGFLITYLLLEEKRISSTIAIKKFYIRRILRIWPLYYFIVFLGFFVLPHISWFDIPNQEVPFLQNFLPQLVCYLFLLPNLAFAVYETAVPNIGQSWSIGVEEQFYIIWPLIMKFAKRILMVMVVFTLVLVTFKVLLSLIPDSTFSWIRTLKLFLAMSKIECMSLGGIGAYVVFHKKEKIMNFCFHPLIQIAAVLSVPLIILFAPIQLKNGIHLLFSFSFLVIIMNVSFNKGSIIKLEHKVLDFLGKISYGIYMYHIICITFTLHVLDKALSLPQNMTWAQNLLYYICSILLTLLVSALSYHYLERVFIRKKKNYTTVISGDEAKGK